MRIEILKVHHSQRHLAILCCFLYKEKKGKFWEPQIAFYIPLEKVKLPINWVLKTSVHISGSRTYNKQTESEKEDWCFLFLSSSAQEKTNTNTPVSSHLIIAEEKITF